MGGGEPLDTASARLLYDDASPRLRRPVNATVLRLRRPAVLLIPLTVALAAAAPAAPLAFLLGDHLPLAPEALFGVFTGFFALVLSLALLLARREEKSFALITPTFFSVLHCFLVLGMAGAFGVASHPTGQGLRSTLAAVPGPPVEGPVLELASAYVVAFAALSVAGLVSVILFRVLGMRRVPVEGADLPAGV